MDMLSESLIGAGVELGIKLAGYIAQEVAAGAKTEAEARHRAIARLLAEHPLEPVLPDVQAQIAAARRPASERDVHAVIAPVDPAPLAKAANIARGVALTLDPESRDALMALADHVDP